MLDLFRAFRPALEPRRIYMYFPVVRKSLSVRCRALFQVFLHIESVIKVRVG